jgi:hypothetical protein
MNQNLIVAFVIGWALSLAPTVHAATSCAGVTIDTRGQTTPPPRGIGPVPTSVPGHAGDFPIELKFLPDLSTVQSDGVTQVVYEMKNIGAKPLQIPTQREQGSMTDPNAKRPFDVFILTLYVPSPNGLSPLIALQQQRTPSPPTGNTLPVLGGQAFLYGREDSEQTVCSLPPGSAMRVIADVKLPSGANDAVQGHAELLRERFDNAISSTIIGTSTSKPFRRTP